MSDLIEKLKQRIREIASCPHADYRNEFYGSLGRFVCENSHEILSALETVRGIEEILSSGSGEVFIDSLSLPGKIVVSTSSDKDVVIEPTLSAAVEAARKGM